MKTGAGTGYMTTTWNDVEILIVGAGTMGASLAQNYAQNGFGVGLLDVSDDILARGVEVIDAELESARGRIFSHVEIGAIRRRIRTGTNYEEACSGPGLRLAIEAATERLDIKKKIFSTLDALARPEVVLASNSSSLDVNILAKATKRPDRVVWMHYFYLPHKNRAAEYAGSDTASPESLETARRYLKLGGKIGTHVRGSRKGGVADIIFVALLHEATRMVEEGFDMAAIEA
ncbi:MAG TPA: 3-hydroxyacyl-CoA dehydrogenase NAD-binding domain-containing protein, partial [Bacteroidota bacterium]|nr:3-hydroxyacyl-CoA dehydrogenase NAD-binding domain-containing protein [Bacteroidota bacterium]